MLAALAFVGWGSSASAESPVAPSTADYEQVANVEAFIAEIENSLRGAKAVFSRFRQERVLSLFDEPLVTEGILLFEQPDNVRWETASPYRSVLLAQGRRVAQFEWIEGERRKIKIGFPEPIRRMMDEIAAVNQGRMQERTEVYEVTGFRGPTARVVMRPRDPALREMISSIEIEMNADMTATEKITMNEPNGDLTRIVILEERRNVAVPPEAFDLKDPRELGELLNDIDAQDEVEPGQ